MSSNITAFSHNNHNSGANRSKSSVELVSKTKKDSSELSSQERKQEFDSRGIENSPRWTAEFIYKLRQYG